MNTHPDFQEIWGLHIQWSFGVLYREIQTLPTSKVFLSDVPTNYLNFALPTVNSPEKLDINATQKILSSVRHKTAFKLFDSHREAGFSEYLVRRGFKLSSASAFFLFNQDNYIDAVVKHEVVEVGTDKLEEYMAVSREAFSNESELAEGYIAMERNFLDHKTKSNFSDVSLNLYAICEDDQVVAIGATFLSKEHNFTYLHDGGTLLEKRGKGYQTSLIRHRINSALKQGITRIYVTADHGNQSWHNCIRNGFNQIGLVESFIEK